MSYEPTVWVDGDHVTSAKLNKLEQGVNSMSYTPTVWNAGDVVTAEKLNKLEQGVAEGGGISTTFPTFTVSDDALYSCDMTYEEAKASYVSTVDEIGKGLAYRLLPNDKRVWAFDVLVSGNDLSYFADVPETVNEGLAVLSEQSNPETLFADNGNFYYTE